MKSRFVSRNPFVTIPPGTLRDVSGNDPHTPTLYHHRLGILRRAFWGRLRALHGLLSVHAVKRARCLDFGGGNGVFLPTLAAGFGMVTVVDLVVGPARRIADLYGLSNASIIQGNIEDAALSLGVFDCVVAADVLEHFPDLSRPLARLKEWLGPGGVLLTSLPTETRLYGALRRVFGVEKPPDHYHRACEVERALAASGFQAIARRPYPFGPDFLSLFSIGAWRRTA